MHILCPPRRCRDRYITEDEAIDSTDSTDAALMFYNTTNSTNYTDSTEGDFDFQWARLLGPITNVLPVNTSITIQPLDGAPFFCKPNSVPPCTEMRDSLYAGQTISKLELNVDPDFFDGSGTMLRLVKGQITEAMADSGACLATDADAVLDAAVNDPWGPIGVDTRKTGNPPGVLEASGTLTFRMGGEYRICYSDDGSFSPGHVDLVPIMLYVNGIYDNRQTCKGRNSCLYNTEYYCYIMMNAYNNMPNEYGQKTSCIVRYDYPDADVIGTDPGKGSWSAPFLVEYKADGSGQIATNAADDSYKITPQPCGGSTPVDIICLSGGAHCRDGVNFFNPDSKRLVYPTAKNDLETNRFKAYNVAACYCPGYDNCNNEAHFIQQVGLLYFFATKICSAGFAHDITSCTPFFSGVAPQYRFSVRVECPGQACSTNLTSRMKIVAQTAANDLPSWDSSNGCAAAVHGRNSIQEEVLPLKESIDAVNIHGGDRQDYKLWNWPMKDGAFVFSEKVTHGFMFFMGTSDHERRNFHGGETFDICFCDGQCDSEPRNWFKTGALRLAPFQILSAAVNISGTPDQFVIEYVNQPGILGFYRPPIDYGVMGLAEGGTVKLFRDNDMIMDDERCKQKVWDRDLVSHSSLYLDEASDNPSSAVVKHSGRKPSLDPDRLVFNSNSLTNTISVKLAGAVAICYCARVDSNRCVDDWWVLASRLTIRGPTPGQSWTFSTHVVFRFDYTGWGLTKDDKMRIIPKESDCSDSFQNPNGAYTRTDIKMQCPDPCSEVGEPLDVVNGDISSIVLADDYYMCDKQNADCRNNDIKKLVILSNKSTELEFEAPPYLETGDLITLGDNFICDPSDSTCTAERLSFLKGRYQFVDRDDNTPDAPDEYIAGHRVTATSNPKKIEIPVGWPDPVPRFQVQYANNKRGRWTRHNRAITREEIVGTRERRELKVCWKYGAHGGQGKFVTEVGKLTLIDPNPMQACLISLTTTVKRQQAPLVLSFKTASAQTGKRYAAVQGHTQLRVFFTRTLAVDITFLDGAQIENNAGEDEITEARQYVCGKIFKELWSSDQELGFPMPKGCYHRSYGMTRELTMLFEKRSGLRAGYDYQIVLNGVAEEEATINGEYAQIFAMDDTEIKPFEAIERGIARLTETPQDPAYGSNGVKFLEPDGFKIVRGTGANMYEVKGGSPLYIELRGEPTGGGITANSLLRIYLWPLTQWNIETQCIVECIPFDQVSAPCGAIQSCMGDATVANFQKNSMIIRLPATMTRAETELYQTLVLMDLRLPEGGFFPTRLAAQISKDDDTKPDYITSVGDFLYKVPDEGQTVGKLVDLYGDGNHKPFREQRGNVIYANVILATTLFAAVQTGDASLKLTLPEGYECVRPVDIDGRSPWEAEPTLGVFGDQIPQGRGTPDEGSGTRGWTVNANTCTFVLRQNAVVYAGSSLFFRITVNNPPNALKRENTTNRWLISLKSKGFHQWFVDFPPVVFANAGVGGSAGTANFADNMAVLGRMEEASMVPSSFAASINQFEIQISRLHIFFKSQQASGVNGFVQVVPPRDFTFNTQCQAGDLEASYYATHQKAENTRRLPGIVSCEYIATPFARAEIGLTGSVVEHTWYAFYVDVQHPATYDPHQQQSWQVFTLSHERYRVDGTPKTVELAPIPEFGLGSNLTNSSYGLYRYALNTPDIRRVEIGVTTLRATGISTVQVDPLNVPITCTSSLRVIAPFGFEWVSNPGVVGAGRFLPGGTVTRDRNVMTWSPHLFEVSKTYGFQASIRLPAHSPTNSVNNFIIELGFESPFFNDRIAAATVPVALTQQAASINPGALTNQLQALSNAHVDYSNNVESKENLLVFQLQIITRIAPGGKIEITGPPGFRPPETGLALQQAPLPRGSPYEVAAVKDLSFMLPADVTVSMTRRLSESNESRQLGSHAAVVITITAGGFGIPPGLYRWQMQLKNPDSIIPNPADASTDCGSRFCWSMNTKTAGGLPLDLGMSVPSFPLNRKLVEAGIPPLTTTQRELTLRDDRPLHQNPLVFQLKLNLAAVDPGYLRIRGPLGFVFREECLSDIEWRGFKVFGEPLTPAYTAWDPDVRILSCRGEGPDADIMVDPGASPGLQPELLYPIRITVVENPASPPVNNLWSIEYAGESADPFVGFPLWTFSRLSVKEVSRAKSSPEVGAVWLRNPVTFTFCPHNTVTGSLMRIEVTAPPTFEIANIDLECKIMVQPLGLAGPDRNVAPMMNFTAPPSMRWGEADVECKVTPNQRNHMVATVLASSRSLMAGHNYQLTVFVYNPTIIPAAGAKYEWKLETYASPQDAQPAFRDLSNIIGYPVNERMKIWLVRNEDPETNLPYLNGKTPVPGLYFEMRFPMKLEYEDVIVIEAPAGFILAGPPPTAPPDTPNYQMPQGATCKNWKWEPPDAVMQYLHKSLINCVGGKMTIVVLEEKPFPELQQIKFRMDTFNVAKTPHVMQNHWTCVHSLNTGQIRSSGAQLSWDIRPQLESVEVLLTGREKAASSMSSMEISFIPVSDADELSLKAMLPEGFDFTGAGSSSLGHEVIATSVEVIRVRCALYADVRATIRLERFKLGRLGGPTKFDIITKLNNGEQMDERLNFEGGFRLPGRVTVVDQQLYSEYKLNPLTYPVQSDWGPRMQETARAVFVFTLTIQANIDTKIKFRAPPYVFTTEYFKLEEGNPASGTPMEVSATVEKVGHGEATAKLNGPLWVNFEWKASMSVTTPSVPLPSDAMWSIEILDDNPLPVNTNDALTEGFTLVYQLVFSIRAGRSPPEAQIQAELNLEPRGTRPNEILLVAPDGFNFTEDCLHDGGTTGEIVSCQRTTPVAGREAAVIRAIPTGLSRPPQYLVIKIITPSMSAPDPAWYLQAHDYITNQELGWGMDSVGVQVRQMRGAGVVFPGIPGISGQMAFRFETNVKVDEDGKIRVGYPRSITINCEGGFLYQVALRGDVRCRNEPRDGYFELSLPRPLPPGRQAFAVTSTAPNAIDDPEGNMFSIKVIGPDDQGSQVVDARMNIPGMRIQHGLKVASLPLIWGSSEASKPATVSLGFELLDELPENQPPVMSEIIIRVPQDFYQSVRRVSQVQMEGSPLPLRSGQWLIFDNPKFIRVLLDTTKTPTLEPGNYRIQFPAWVPARIPNNNVWIFTICSNQPGTCVDELSDRALVSFPTAGFQLNQVHPSTRNRGVDATVRMAAGGFLGWLLAGSMSVMFAGF